jgi:hypothetical protein
MIAWPRRPNKLGVKARAMLQNLSKEIRECLGRAEECKRLSQAAQTETSKTDFSDGTPLAISRP